MAPLPLLPVIAALVAASLAAQDVRQRVRGSVRARDGSPWTGAQVLLVSCPLPEARRIGLDVQRATSDERGRFEAELRPGCFYTAWAQAAPGPGGTRLTEIVERVAPGVTPHLLESARPCPSLRLELAGLARWQDRGPIRIEAVTRTENPFAVPVELDAEGRGTLPPLPGHDCLLEGFLGDGSAFLVRVVTLARDAAAAVETVELPERRRLLVRVVDRDNRGVEGVAIQQRFSSVPYAPPRATSGDRLRCGTTDAEGWAVADLVPWQDETKAVDTRQAMLTVQSTRCALASFTPAFHAEDRDLDARRRAGIADHLQRTGDVYAVRGRVLVGNDPARRLPLLLFAACTTARAASLSQWPVTAVTGDDGRFAFPGWGPSFAWRLVAVLGDEHRRVLAAPSDTATLSVLGQGGASADVDLGDVDLQRLVATEVQVARADGTPAAAAAIGILESGQRQDGWTVHGNPLRVAASRRGSLRLLMPRDARFAVAAQEGGGFANGTLVAGGQPTRLDLTMPVRLSGRIVDEDGKAVPGTGLSVTPAAYPPGVDARLFTAFGWLQPVVDETGAFAVFLPFRHTAYRLQARVLRGGGVAVPMPPPVLVSAEDRDPEPVEITLPAKL